MIRFPRMHIAASVQNRILNMADNLAAQSPTGQRHMPQPPPIGKALDMALAQPVGPMAAPVEAEAVAATASGTGGSAAEALAGQAITEAFV